MFKNVSFSKNKNKQNSCSVVVSPLEGSTTPLLKDASAPAGVSLCFDLKLGQIWNVLFRHMIEEIAEGAEDFPLLHFI